MRYSIFDAVLVVLRPSSEVLLLGDGLHDDLCQELSTFPCRMDAVGLHDAIGGHAFRHDPDLRWQIYPLLLCL